LFLELLQLVETVVCARATPSQKAGMVINIKKKLGKTCLAIGDGANDVSMIQKANVGVGLTGKEGSQAAQASDFVLHRFRHLPRLLFVHGRFAYIRICKVVYWSFYKNTLFPFPLFLYGIFSGWSSQPLYDALIMNLFNVLLTSLPPLVGGWVEKDAREAVLLKHPETYSEFRESRQFSIKVFMSWVLLGITQSLVIFWFAFGVFYDIDVIKQDGKTVGIFTFGSWQCTAILFVINLTFLINANNWPIAMILSCAAGPFIYLAAYPIYGWSTTLSYDLYGTSVYLFTPALAYLYNLVAISLCTIPVFYFGLYQREYTTSKLNRAVRAEDNS